MMSVANSGLSVISFSIFGQDPKYAMGLLKNLRLATEVYPGWVCFVFTDLSADPDILKTCLEMPHVKVFDMSKTKIPGMFWRFLPIDVDQSVTRMIVRDTDSRLSEREKMAVDEWIKEGKALHIMRDHPHHNSAIMGGMWGFYPKGRFSFSEQINLFKPSNEVYVRYEDQRFLAKHVYPKWIMDSTIHASFHKLERHAKPFPGACFSVDFVGEIFEADDSRPYRQRDLKLLTHLTPGIE